MPLEILEAAGLRPYRILPDTGSEKADAYLDPNFCSLIKASLGEAVGGGYAFLSGLVMVNTCDGMRRLFDAWRAYCPVPFSYMLDVPRIITPSSVRYFEGRLRALVSKMEGHYGLEITSDALRRAIAKGNETRALVKRLMALQGRGRPPLCHGDILELVYEGFKMPRQVFNEALRRFIAKVETEPEAPANGVRVVVSGSLQCGSALVRLVEELGGEVNATDCCTGGRFLDEVKISDDPISSLSEAYLGKRPCARMADSQRRIDLIEEQIKKTKARGIIYSSLKFCDLYLYEVPVMKEAFHRMGIPALFIEGEFSDRIGGGTRTRVQAFLEMLGRDGG